MYTSTVKVELFSDGVIAIIITIMVLELKLPEFDVMHNAASIEHHLLKLLPHFGAYIFSFVMVGILWFNHHHMFNLLERTDNFMLAQNLFFLFWMSLIPFVTGIVGANPLLPISIACYGLIMVMTTLTLSFMRAHSLNKGLVHKDEDQDFETKIEKVTVKDKIRSFVGSAAYVASIPLAFVSVYVSYACFLIPIVLFLWPSTKEDAKLSEKVIEKNTI